MTGKVCYLWNRHDEEAIVDIIVKIANGKYISKSGTEYKYAIEKENKKWKN